MKCQKCNGTGKVRKYFYEKVTAHTWKQVEGDCPCEDCNGTGEVDMTNEEWFATLSTKEKAEWMSSCIYCEDCKIRNYCFKDFNIGCMCKDVWEKWLKQPHES